MSDTGFSTADFYGEADNEHVEIDSEAFTADDDIEAPAADDGPAEGGQAEDAVEQAKNFFDPSQFADHVVVVKVDGEEVEVPVAELPNGYMRHADYTRKTQEIAAERQQLDFWKTVDQAMRVKPVETLQYLQQQFGVQAPQAPAATEPADPDWQFEDPADAKLAEFQKQVAPALEFYQQQQAKQYLDTVLTQLQTKYGDDFNPKEVVQHAVQNLGITDPSGLDYAYKDLAFERMRAQAAAQQQHGDQRAADDAARQAAAQKAAGVISSGGGARSGASQTPAPQARTIREAYELAKQTHGGGFN